MVLGNLNLCESKFLVDVAVKVFEVIALVVISVNRPFGMLAVGHVVPLLSISLVVRLFLLSLTASKTTNPR